MRATPYLRLFGPPALLAGPGGPEIRFRTRKQLALLVCLAMERDTGGILRDRVVDMLWPRTPVGRGRHSLSQALTAIRQRVGPEAITRTATRLCLAVALDTDLLHLTELRPPLGGLGQPLDDLDRCGGPEFAHWVEATRQQVRRMARQAMHGELRQCRERGDPVRLYGLATRLHELDPFDVTAVHALAEEALLDGRVGAAARQLREFLKREEGRGGDPSHHPATRRLLARIDSGAHPPIGVAVRETGGDVPTERFLGRRAELARLEYLWEEAASHQSLRACLVSGVAGIGKSSLARRFATSVAARGNLVLLAFCQEIGPTVPFAALADLIITLARDPALGATDPHWLSEASRIAPALKARYPGIPDPAPAPSESIRLRVAEASFRMIETVADGAPVLLVLDDVQHLDHASRDVLHVLMRRLRDTPVLLMAAVRTHGLHAASGLTEPTFDPGEWHARMELPALGPGESRELVDVLAEDLTDTPNAPRIAGTIARLAGGNPYFIEMLVADWRTNTTESLAAVETFGDGTGAKWRPPDTLRLAFSRIYDGVSEGARHTLDVLAVAGRAMTAQELGRRLGHSVIEASRFVLDALGRGVLRVDGDAVSFKNELHRAFVYYAMSDETRRYHHARLARALAEECDGPGGGAGRTLEAAHHFIRAAMPAEGMSAALVGSRAAVMQGASREAEHALRKAVEAAPGPPPADAFLLLAEALNQQGQYAEAIAALEHLNGETISPIELAKKAALRAEALVRGRLGDGLAISVQVKAMTVRAKRAGDLGLQLRAVQISAENAADDADCATLLACEQEVKELTAEISGTENNAAGELTMGFCTWARGLYTRAYKKLESASTRLETSGRRDDQVRAMNGCGMCCYSIGEFGIARAWYERALHLAQTIGGHPSASNIASNLGVVLTDLGEYADAGKAFAKAFELDRVCSGSRYSATILNKYAELLLSEGNLDRAVAALAEVGRFAESSTLPWLKAWSHTIRADCVIAAGSVEDAISEIATAFSIAGDSQRYQWHTHSSSLTRLLVYRAWVIGTPFPAGPSGTAPLSLVAELEFQIFSEWLHQQGGPPPPRSVRADALIKATGLDGLKKRLERTGMYPGIH